MILIGHAGHPEVEGTLGRISGITHLVGSIEDVNNLNVGTPDQLSYITQTTLSVDDTREIIIALKTRFPNIKGPALKDICYATQNRQQAVRDLAQHEHIGLLLVIGGKNSSNSNRLREIGTDCGVPSYLIDDATAFDSKWLEGVESIGITAGASAPEILVQGLLDRIALRQPIKTEILSGIEENMHFNLPKELRDRDG